MFEFTKTTFVHSEDLFKANPNGTKGTFWADGNLFRKDNIVAVFRSPYISPVNGKLIIDIKSVMKNAACTDRFRLNFYIRRTGDVNGYWANAFVYKGKDFHYEWDGRTTTSKALAKLIKGINKLYGDIYLKVYAGTESKNTENGIYVNENGNLVIETDNYGLFTEATIEKWVETEADCCVWRDAGHWEVLESLDEWDCPEAVTNCSIENMTNNLLPQDKDLKDLIPKVQIKKSTVAGCGETADGNMRAVMCVNGTGTYEQVMKDLRLPTAENLRWLSPNSKEMPNIGMNYVQYTIHMVACRGILGGSAVGEVTHSKTTHVFFVPSTCCSCDGSKDLDVKFLEALTAAGIKVYNAPHNDPTVERNAFNNVEIVNKLTANIYVAKPSSTEEEETEEGKGGFDSGDSGNSGSGANSGNSTNPNPNPGTGETDHQPVTP